MNINLRTFALAAGIAITSTASAEMTTGPLSGAGQIQPLEAYTVHAEDYSAVVYFTVLENGTFEVVTTIAPVDGSDVVGSQQRATMAIGQTYSLSLQLADEDTLTSLAGIRFLANSDSLSVTEL